MRTNPVKSRVFTPVGTYFTESFYDDMGLNFAWASVCEAISGAGASATVTLQESASPDSVVDGSAVWSDLGSALAAQSATGVQKGTNTAPHFTRKRFKVVIAGTTPSATMSFYLEGERKDK